MEPVNVLVLFSAGEEGLRRIAAVSPRIKLTDASNLFRAEQAGDQSVTAELDASLAEA